MLRFAIYCLNVGLFTVRASHVASVVVQGFMEEIFRAAQPGSRPEGPRAKVGSWGEGGGLGSAVSCPGGVWDCKVELHTKLILVHSSLKVWHLVTTYNAA